MEEVDEIIIHTLRDVGLYVETKSNWAIIIFVVHSFSFAALSMMNARASRTLSQMMWQTLCSLLSE